ncbi:MAG TPA: hypothetical protein VLC48_05375 [Gemmatimonadota bacterium]|nr:hypothetical protein [Gemmatimonadota bacterium]
MKRAIFVLTSPEAGEQFLRVLPDLRGMGLTDATVLHLLSAEPGPAEPMPELANWVRHFEAAIPNVELALKRGDPVKWLYDLARVRKVDIVVIAGATEDEDWDLERVSSPLRRLGIPILFLPECPVEGALASRVLVAIRAPEAFERAVNQLADCFGAGQLRAVRVAEEASTDSCPECAGVRLETIAEDYDVATTLLKEAEEYGATLLTILADEGEDDGQKTGIPVVKPLIDETDRPVMIWPAAQRVPA